MASLDSEEVRKALTSKLRCEEQRDGDHVRFVLRDSDGKILSRTKISHGPRHTIGNTLIHKMARQIQLGTSANFVGLVACTKTREECLAVIHSMCQNPQY